MLLIKDAVYRSRLLRRLLQRLLRRLLWRLLLSLLVGQSLILIVVAAIYKEGRIHFLTGVFLLLYSN